MLKFVKQGDSGHGHGELASLDQKDGDHDCNVCKTRRRSLDRQAAGVLRRSRSRETLRSIGNTSSNEDDTCISDHAKMNQDDNERQVGGAQVWRAKLDKYRRFSRSCEALSMSNKAAHRRQDDTVDDLKATRDTLPGRTRAGQTVGIGGRPLSQDLETNDMGASMGRNRRIHCSQRVPTECETRHLGVKESRYTHDERWASPMDKGNSDPGKGGKQVQFGGVEFEKSKEDSVMEKLRNVVSGHRRKLRSRSLERVDRRYEWNPQTRDFRDSRTEGNRRSRPKSWARDVSITPSVASCERESDSVNYQHLQQLENYQRRYRSRSKECEDRTDECESRQGRRDEYRYDDNQSFNLTPIASWQIEHVTESRTTSANHRKVLPDARTYDLQYQSPSRIDISRSASYDLERTCYPPKRDQTCTLIAPKYNAPNGHYGNAVVRKCPREQKHTTKEQSLRNTRSKSPKLEHKSRKGDGVVASEQASDQKVRQLGKGSARRSSIPKLEKCGISATKIAKLDTPLKVTAPDPSLLSKMIDAPTVLIITDEDAAGRTQQNTDTLLATSPRAESCHENDPDSVGDNESCSSGYVYNCSTSKITKLSRPETKPSFEHSNSQLQNHGNQFPSNTKEKLSPSDTESERAVCPKETRKLEATNNLVRQASVASLSLISVNSVDSGTSCHEGSTTDSTSSSSDKEMEIQGKPPKQRLGREARRYTASAKELENLILASCFGKDKYVPGLVTSDYESDTGPEVGRNQTGPDGRRRGGVSRVVRLAGSKDDMEGTRDSRKNQQSKHKGQAHNSSKMPAADIKQRYPDPSPSNHHLLAKLTASAHVLHNHKAMSKAEMSVQKGDLVHLMPEDLEQRPLWVRAYSRSSGQTGFIPSVYLGTN